VPTIVIPESVREQILAHAREGEPQEICGILAGTRTGTGLDEDEHSDENEHRVKDEHRVETRHPTGNIAATPRTKYEIDPREQLESMEVIEEVGREVVGFYHSHPEGPAGPSATDSAQATWPGRSYVIVSLEGTLGESEGEAASLGSWRWTGEEFVEETVRVE
jgi:proteasome lid subunit RPN8/RPN11